jgi:hypothetical protein
MILELHWTDLTNQFTHTSYAASGSCISELHPLFAVDKCQPVGDQGISRDGFTRYRGGATITPRKSLHLGATRSAPETQKLGATPDIRSDMI